MSFKSGELKPYQCPLSKKVFKYPVVWNSYTFEREALYEYISKCPANKPLLCPIEGKPVDLNTEPLPRNILKSMKENVRLFKRKNLNKFMENIDELYESKEDAAKLVESIQSGNLQDFETIMLSDERYSFKRIVGEDSFVLEMILSGSMKSKELRKSYYHSLLALVRCINSNKYYEYSKIADKFRRSINSLQSSRFFNICSLLQRRFGDRETKNFVRICKIKDKEINRKIERCLFVEKKYPRILHFFRKDFTQDERFQMFQIETNKKVEKMKENVYSRVKDSADNSMATKKLQRSMNRKMEREMKKNLKMAYKSINNLEKKFISQFKGETTQKLYEERKSEFEKKFKDVSNNIMHIVNIKNSILEMSSKIEKKEETDRENWRKVNLEIAQNNTNHSMNLSEINILKKDVRESNIELRQKINAHSKMIESNEIKRNMILHTTKANLEIISEVKKSIQTYKAIFTSKVIQANMNLKEAKKERANNRKDIMVNEERAKRTEEKIKKINEYIGIGNDSSNSNLTNRTDNLFEKIKEIENSIKLAEDTLEKSNDLKKKITMYSFLIILIIVICAIMVFFSLTYFRKYDCPSKTDPFQCYKDKFKELETSVGDYRKNLRLKFEIMEQSIINSQKTALREISAIREEYVLTKNKHDYLKTKLENRLEFLEEEMDTIFSITEDFESLKVKLNSDFSSKRDFITLQKEVDVINKKIDDEMSLKQEVVNIRGAIKNIQSNAGETCLILDETAEVDRTFMIQESKIISKLYQIFWWIVLLGVLSTIPLSMWKGLVDWEEPKSETSESEKNRVFILSIVQLVIVCIFSFFLPLLMYFGCWVVIRFIEIIIGVSSSGIFKIYPMLCHCVISTFLLQPKKKAKRLV